MRILYTGFAVISSSLFLLSCDDNKPSSPKQNKPTNAAASANTIPQITEPAGPAAVFSVKDTASLKCYINAYTSPYKVKIFNEGYVVDEKDFPAFIAAQKNELQKYRIYILTTQKSEYKKTIELLDVLTVNDIRDFEIVEDGKASR